MGTSANCCTTSAQVPLKPRHEPAEGQLPPSGPPSKMDTTSAQQFTAKQSAYSALVSDVRDVQA